MSVWWLCPNDPPCRHGAVLHDIEDYDDPSPTCCADGCDCGTPELIHEADVYRMDMTAIVIGCVWGAHRRRA